LCLKNLDIWLTADLFHFAMELAVIGSRFVGRFCPKPPSPDATTERRQMKLDVSDTGVQCNQTERKPRMNADVGLPTLAGVGVQA